MARYFLRFRHSDTGLTPAFNFFKKASDLSSQVAPPIGEVGSGTYYFDYSPAFDVVFEVDGGAAIPTEEVRYISDTISPKDTYIDEPVSQVRTDVWTDSTSYAAGQKGIRVDQIGDPTDTSSAATVFGKTLLYKESVRGDSAGSSDGENVKLARDRIMGGTGYGGTGVDVKTVSDTIGSPADTSASSTLFGKALLYKEATRGDSAGMTDGNSVKQTYDRVGVPLGGFSTIADQLGDPSGTNSIAQDIAALQSVADTLNAKVGTPVTSVSADVAAVKAVVDTINVETDAASIADAVWDAATAGNVTAGTMGGLVNTAASISVPSAATVAGAVWDVTLSAHLAAGSTGEKLNTPAVDSAAVTAAVWDVPMASHVGAGTTGNKLNTPAVDAATVTAAVWDVPIASHLSAGSTGEKLNTPAIDSSAVTAAVWDVPMSGHTTIGTTGQKLSSASASAGVQFYSNGDTAAPIIIQVSTPRNNQVKVTFSEPMTMTTASDGALNPLNYAITPSIAIISVVQVTSQQVLLTTATQSPNTLYTLTVVNATDIHGNPIA